MRYVQTLNPKPSTLNPKLGVSDEVRPNPKLCNFECCL